MSVIKVNLIESVLNGIIDLRLFDSFFSTKSYILERFTDTSDSEATHFDYKTEIFLGNPIH